MPRWPDNATRRQGPDRRRSTLLPALATAIERDEQVKTGQTMIDAVAALTAAMERSNELTTLFLEHGDAFREFMDSL